MWYCSHELLSSSYEMAWLHFKTANLDECSLYLRHEGHEMKLKFMTSRQASNDQHRLMEKIEKERNINCRRKGNWRKRKGRKDKDNGKGTRETRCLIEGHPCLICDMAPTNSFHLLLRWAWLHFKMLNLVERSLYLRHKGHEMKLKFMTPRQASKD